MRCYSRIHNCKNCKTKLKDGVDIFSTGLNYWAKCPKCGKQISGRGDYEEAILRWNNTKKTNMKKLKINDIVTVTLTNGAIMKCKILSGIMGGFTNKVIAYEVEILSTDNKMDTSIVGNKMIVDRSHKFE